MLTSINKVVCCTALLSACGIGLAALGHGAQAAAPKAAPGRGQRTFGDPTSSPIGSQYPGQIMVRLAPGLHPQDAVTLAHNLHLEVSRQLRHAPNTFVFTGSQADVNAAAGVLPQTAGVIGTNANHVFLPASLPTVVPDDGLYSSQWALRQLNAPSVYGITVGERLENGPIKQVKVGLIDSGPDTSHPDLAENIDPNGYDFVLDQPYDPISAQATFDSHGTNVASCIAAVSNNEQGMASLPWEGVTILPCRVNDFVTQNNTTSTLFSESAIVDAIYYCIEQNVDVINMSFELAINVTGSTGQFTDPILEQAISDAYNQGIVLVGASGDDRFFFGGGTSTTQPFGVSYPASLPQVISVGGVGPSGEVAFYSNGGSNLDVVAPGGNDANTFDPNREVIVADTSGFVIDNTLPSGYTVTEGTSIAAGYASSAVALLISQGARDTTLAPSDQVEAIRTLLHSTARNPLGAPNSDYGYGIIDVSAALRKVTQYIDVTAPVQAASTDSFSEPLDAQIVQPVSDDPLSQDPSNFNVFENGTDITDLVQVLDADNGIIHYEPDINSRYSVGVNTLNIRADNGLQPGAYRSLEGTAIGHIPDRGFQFRVTPRVLQAGLRLLSIPYDLRDEANDLTFLFGGNLVRTARWLPSGTGASSGQYAIYDIVGSPQDPEASLKPPPSDVSRDPTDPVQEAEYESANFSALGVKQPPVGLGYWARVTTPTQTQLLGRSIRSSFYEIKLKPGFNLIGNPYPFRVPWNVVTVRNGNVIMSVSDAAKQNLISNVIWRYLDGRYTFSALPNGELVDWEAHWVRAYSNISIIVPKIASVLGQNAAAPAPDPTRVASGWSSTVRAREAGKSIGAVTVGRSTSAREGWDEADVELPPYPQGQSNIRIRHGDWGRYNGQFAQDIRSRKVGSEQWKLEVETFHPGSSVQLAWDRFPAGTTGYVRVDGTNEIHRIDGKSGFSFVPRRAGVQHLTLVTTSVPGA